MQRRCQCLAASLGAKETTALITASEAKDWSRSWNSDIVIQCIPYFHDGSACKPSCISMVEGCTAKHNLYKIPIGLFPKDAWSDGQWASLQVSWNTQSIPRFPPGSYKLLGLDGTPAFMALTSFLGWGSHVLHLIPASKVQAHYPAALLRATRLSQIQKRKLVGHRDRAGPCIILRFEESRGSVTSLRSKIKIHIRELGL